MAKASNAVRTTITVPADLKRRMEKVRGVNWSAIAAQAFEGKLAEVAQKKKGLDMDTVRERLLASKNSELPASYSAGFDAGVEWAKTTAEYMQLKRLAKLRESYVGQPVDFDDNFAEDSGIAYVGNDMPGWLATNMIGPDSGYDDVREFWESVFDDEVDEWLEDWEALRGFCHGAIEVFEEADV